jgi:hypothetical protein
MKMGMRIAIEPGSPTEDRFSKVITLENYHSQTVRQNVPIVRRSRDLAAFPFGNRSPVLARA